MGKKKKKETRTPITSLKISDNHKSNLPQVKKKIKIEDQNNNNINKNQIKKKEKENEINPKKQEKEVGSIELKANLLFNSPEITRGFTTYTLDFSTPGIGTIDCKELQDEFEDVEKELHHRGFADICWEENISSQEKAQKLFEWMIAPMSTKDFFTHFWEKQPLHIKSRPNDYYSFMEKEKKRDLFTQIDISEALKERPLIYGQHLDITKYQNGKRYTLNPTENSKKKTQNNNNEKEKIEKVIAKNEQVFNFFEKEGCSIRMLHPQTWNDNLWMVLSVLEEFFDCQVGCNTYLTPKKCQGFSPHYDNVEAFALQTEGAKKWKLYEPLEPSQKLCRYSSRNFEQNELPQPLTQIILETGDLLYFPRGYIHQCISVSDRDSHHVTLSTALKNTWYDFMDLIIPQALSLAFEDNIEFRKSIPRESFSHLGVIYSTNEEDEHRISFQENFLKLYDILIDYLPIDTSMDQMAAQFLYQRILPHPSLLGQKKPVLQMGSSSKKTLKKKTKNLSLDSFIRLSIFSSIRTSSDEEKVTLFSPMKNERELHAKQEIHITELNQNDFKSNCEFPIIFTNAIEHLIDCYPDWIKVIAIPFLDNDDQKLSLAKTLVKKGMCVIKEE